MKTELKNFKPLTLKVEEKDTIVFDSIQYSSQDRSDAKPSSTSFIVPRASIRPFRSLDSNTPISRGQVVIMDDGSYVMYTGPK